MATVSPSPDSAPSNVPPPLPSTPPQSQPSAPPQSQPSTPPSQPAAPPPVVAQPNANPPDPSSPPTPNVPPPTNVGPPPVTPPPVDISPPPSTPPPSSPVAPPPTPPTASPPPTVSSPPPSQTGPPVSTPPPSVVPPPSTPANPPTSTPSPPANPPTSTPSPPANPPTSTPSPPGSATPPPTSTPTPPSTPPPTSTPTPPSANPPSNPPPSPPSPSPPEDSPPPPTSRPPEGSPPPPPTSPDNPSAPPSPPSSEPPQSPPSSPAASPPPGTSPPSSSGSPPPSDRPQPASPPSSIPGPPTPDRQISPSSPGADTVLSPPSLPGNRPSGNSPDTASNSSGHGGIGTGAAVAIGIVAGLIMLGLLGLVGLWIFKRKKKFSGPYDGHVIPASIGSSPRSDGKLLVKTEYPGSSSNFGGGSGTETPSDHAGFGHSRSWFTYQELYEATSGFSDEKLLGEGGFGRVYKGLLADGRMVAVKQLKVGGGQGEREFKAEVEIISRIHHRHLVSLVGYCILETKRLLVYDYVPNDTLHFHLHGNGRPVMDWTTRVKIAVGAARGITYLHEDCHPRIIHRDIKSSNILLDNNFEAQVSDFGLAKLAMDADTHVSTRVMGTFGYMAPEYATSGKLTEKSDVFSFGVVLLELITGRKPVDESQPLGDESLVEWARPLLTHALDTGELDGLVDALLEKNYIESEMLRMIEAAAACVRHSAVKRPRMGLVLRALSMSDSGDLSNGLRVGESQLYDSAQQSAEIRWFRRMAFGSQNVSTGFFSNPSQNIGFSGQSRQNAAQSTQHEQQNSQSMGLRNQSGNSSNFSAERHPTQQSPGLWNQSGNNTNFSAERQSTQHNLGFRNQSGNNLNFSVERHSTQQSTGTINPSFHREDSGNL